jgi:hypothetical protein
MHPCTSDQNGGRIDSRVRDKNCDQLKKAFSFLSKNAIQG